MYVSEPLKFHRPALTFETAIITGGVPTSYHTLRAEVDAAARKLVLAGVEPGQVVGVYVNQSAVHWRLLLALIRIGAVSVSLSSRHGDEIAALPELSAIICLGENKPSNSELVRQIEIDESIFVASEPKSILLPSQEQAEERLGRICFTSGSSGAPKAIFLESSKLRKRLSGTVTRNLISRTSVLWCGLGPDSAYGFTAPLAAWMLGGTVVLQTQTMGLYDQIVRSGVNLIISSPVVLDGVLKSRGGRDPSPGGRRIIAAGGPLSEKLRDALLTNVCSEIYVAYGSSEAGGISLGRMEASGQSPGAVGAVFPGITLQIVDEEDNVLPPNVVGRVRVRTESCATSYMADVPATKQHFLNGWFYPGDMAFLSQEGTLFLQTRSEEVLNVSGVKVAAERIEGITRLHGGVEDACALMLFPKGGQPRLAIVVVASPAVARQLPAQLRASLPDIPAFSIVPVSAIPRSAMGKVSRLEFGRQIMQKLAPGDSVPENSDFEILTQPEGA